jgi:hypothetical protein
MIGQTVCIHCPRAEWSELKGRYGTVTNQWCDGSVCVEVERWYGSKARISFARFEIEHVAMNDFMRHRADEECAMVCRSIDLSGLARNLPWISDKVRSGLLRRAESLKIQIRAFQRIMMHSLGRCADRARLDLPNCCTAIIPYAGGAS